MRKAHRRLLWIVADAGWGKTCPMLGRDGFRKHLEGPFVIYDR